MAKVSPFDIEGFDALNKKIKQLPDRVKRKEVLAIQKKLAKPVQTAYAGNLPKRSGTLSKSVAIKAVSARRSGGNPTISIAPGKRGKNDGYYKFMVVPKGTAVGSNKRGSRKGLNTVTPEARDKTLKQSQSGLTREAEAKVAAYIQKKIDKLT